MPLKSKTPAPNLAGIESLDEVARRYFSDKKRQSMPAKRFAGPGRTYPIENQDDLDNAARLIGHADDPEAVKRKAISIAKELGLSLPDSWQAEEASKAVAKRADQPEDGNEDGDPDGKHTDGESATQLYDRLASVHDPDDGDGNEDDTEEGDEDLKPEAVGGRAESDVTIARSDMPEAVSYYAPITRIDKEKREVIGTATAEVKDAYKTVIGFEASKAALTKWPGNIREMHDPKTAVGRALEVTPDPKNKRVIVRARISRGAEDTWQKVLDGTLTGFSIGGKNGKWTTRVIDGEELPYLERYDAVELSLVDNPACPGCNIEVVRADGFASDVLATEQEMNTTKSENARTPGGDDADSVERAGARISSDTRDALHKIRDHAMSTCGCDECGAMSGDNDNDGDERSIIADIVRQVVADTLRDQVAPVLSRVNALLASDAQRSDESPEITRRVDDMTTQLADIKKLVEEIHAQPADGGPVLHGGGPVDKVLATSAQRSHGGSDAEAIQRAMALGFSPPDDPQEQIRAASKLFRPIPR